jgi:hypothetical protein
MQFAPGDDLQGSVVSGATSLLDAHGPPLTEPFPVAAALQVKGDTPMAGR